MGPGTRGLIGLTCFGLTLGVAPAASPETPDVAARGGSFAEPGGDHERAFFLAAGLDEAPLFFLDLIVRLQADAYGMRSVTPGSDEPALTLILRRIETGPRFSFTAPVPEASFWIDDGRDVLRGQRAGIENAEATRSAQPAAPGRSRRTNGLLESLRRMNESRTR